MSSSPSSEEPNATTPPPQSPPSPSPEPPSPAPQHGVFHTSPPALDIGAAAPWIEQTVQQLQQYHKLITESTETAIAQTKARLDRIRYTSEAHFYQTRDMLQDVKSEYKVYEDVAVGKAKEGILAAASNPWLTAGAVLGLGFLGLERSRHFLYFRAMRLFTSEEALLTKANARVVELRRSIDHLKAEGEKLEATALEAEKELIRGRTKLKQAGKQIQSVIGSAYKIERQAGGLKDIVKEFPRREASQFRSQVSKLASEAKHERNALSKEVSKISNYGISV